jgi:predicted LPLAT superfamily acyltransferase
LGMFGSENFELNLVGTDIFLDTLAQGKGLILLSAHVGNWHLAINFLGNTKTKVHLVTDEARQSEVRQQMDQAKEMADHLVIHDARQGMDLIFELRSILDRGEIVILAADRVTGGRKTQARFLDGTAWFPTTAYYLARLSGAPICTALSFRTGMQSYNCYGIGPFWLKSWKSNGPRIFEIDETVAQFAHHLEKYICLYPYQWFNFFDFWKTQGERNT